jgi:hypothetical protein
MANRDALSMFVNRVFNISYGNGWGTAFLLKDENGSFFVTAKHVVGGLSSGDNLQFIRNDKAELFKVAEAAHAENVDLSIFALTNLGPPKGTDLSVASVGLALGDQLYFLGFPHGLRNTYPTDAAGFPAPLVRSAIFSGVVNLEGEETLILDGFNNPGYSGAPVLQILDEGKFGFVGLISGYRFESASHSSIYERAPDGTSVPVANLFTRQNSGMIYAVLGSHVTDLRKALKARNPIAEAQPGPLRVRGPWTWFWEKL